ncbi:hypothetical protein EXN66_Car020301 [Channa argus]|uniref:Uncharacterized protein n=1 Tax=Channa argus TaxID=215402 RepID=A0A6G1QPU4_CHAAH|nr:hypothetical protein EXN66_Car020301 [Channa argus]
MFKSIVHPPQCPLLTEEEGETIWQETVGRAGYKYMGTQVKTIRVNEKQEAKGPN